MTTKIRTEEDLEDNLNSEFGWRIKEIDTLKKFVFRSKLEKGGNSKSVLIRSGIALLYAHWEGFIKITSKSYLEFIVSQNLKYTQLTINFIALGLRAKINNAIFNKSIQSQIELSDYVINNLGSNCQKSIINTINTKANLSSKVLNDIIICLGFDFSPYATKSVIIDEILLNNRNHIAHGDYLLVDDESFFNLCDDILYLMHLFKDQISNAAALKEYIN